VIPAIVAASVVKNAVSGFCAELLAGMEPLEEVIRSSGQYGPKVEVPDDADPQTKLLGFIGRDPCWVPAGSPRAR
jgi:hypothetical protein